MSIQRFIIIICGVIGMIFLNACHNRIEISTGRQDWNNHLHLTNFETLSIDNNGNYSLQIPVVNGADEASPPANLTVQIEYVTNTNGGTLSCESDRYPTTQPCKPPVRCTQTHIYQIPSLSKPARWDSPTTIIGPDSGECVCRVGQCEGFIRLHLTAPNDPRLEKLPNTGQIISWNSKGRIIMSGYRDRPFPE
jgi:hypothetical protein